MKSFLFPTLLAVASVALSGASCKKSSAEADEASAKEVVAAIDKTQATEEAKSPKLPIPGVDLSKLDAGKKVRFEKLVDSLVSPCGKAHSLRYSATKDKTCKRAPYAARYVAFLLEEEADDVEVRNHYKDRYVGQTARKFAMEGVPLSGPADAPVTMVEFYDYGCPACQQAAPIIERVLAENSATVAVYYKQYPLLSHHPDSDKAAQAALAAHMQGKFKQMHKLLFAKAPKHTRDDVFGYAKDLGLDMVKFAADYERAAPMVKADMAEGDKVDVRGTPTLFINGRLYDDPFHPRFFAMWIEEELGVNR